MAREAIKDNHNTIIGYIDSESNGDQKLLDSHNTILGYYKRSSDKTTDAHNTIIGSGNQLMRLLR